MLTAQDQDISTSLAVELVDPSSQTRGEHSVLALLARPDRSELCDNRMTVFAPSFGLGSVHYWNGSWDNDEDQNPYQAREIFENRDGELMVVNHGEIDILQLDYRQWRPDRIRARYIGSRHTVWEEEKGIDHDTAVSVIRFAGSGLKRRRVILGHRITKRAGLRIDVMTGRGAYLFAEYGQYEGIHRFIGFAGDLEVRLRECDDAVYVEAELEVLPERFSEIAYVVAAGEEIGDTRQRWETAMASPRDTLDGARRRWERFFDEQVPGLECDNSRWISLYYHSCYALRANLYNFKKGAIRHPYSCPTKFKYLPSWFWDPCFHGFSEKWLVDYPAPLSTFRNHFDAQKSDGYLPMTIDHRGDTWRAVGAIDQACQQFLHPITIWDHYLVHGDKNALAETIPHLLAHDEYLRRHRESGPNAMFLPKEGGELADNSVRLVADPAQRDKIGALSTRIEPIDWNTYHYASLRTIARMAAEVGNASTAQAMTMRADAKLRALTTMWNPHAGIFTDRTHPGGELTSGRFSGAFVSMLGGYPTSNQTAQMCELLLDPNHFWTHTPIPGVSVTDEAFDCSDTYDSYWNGRVWPNINWSVIEGLCRCHRPNVARKLLDCTLEMHFIDGRPWCLENFHPLEPKRYSTTHCPFNQGWGALGIDLILRRGLGLQFVAPRDQIHFAPLGLAGVREATVRGLPFADRRIDVDIDLRTNTPIAHVRGRNAPHVVSDAHHWLDI